MSDAILEVCHLHWSYDPSRTVLRDVSLIVRRGERVALIGPNGAGKTTLIKCLNGLLRPTQGEVRLMGRPVASYKTRALARLAAYVPQPMGSGLPFRVRDFVMMGRYPHWSMLSNVSAADRRAVDRALTITGTQVFADRYHATLSGGERQKVMLAAALAQESELLLLDEPSAFLDPGHQHEIDGILLTVSRQRGVTIVSATHDLNRAALANDRIVGIRDGAIVCDASPAAALAPEILDRLYGTRFATVLHPETGLPMVLPRAPVEVQT
jgi:iron complex transport system ATP-binding protein